MANNYFGTSFAFEAPSAEEAQYAMRIVEEHNAWAAGDTDTGPLAELKYSRLPDVVVESDGTTLWIGDESIDTDAIAAFLLHLVRRWNCEPIAFQYAYWCDKLRVDEFGGGAFVVSKDGIKSMHTSQWIAEQLSK